MRCRESWTAIGPDSYRRQDGELRTFLAPGRVTRLLGPDWEVLEHDEAPGPDHRHGDGPVHHHHVVAAVLRRVS